jgi:hypothetical protein
MLREMVSRGTTPLRAEEAVKYDQRPFGTMIHRQWIKYIPKKGFVITHEGRAAWEDFNAGNIFRHDTNRPLSHYFDPTLYGLNDPRKTKKKRPPKKKSEEAVAS